MDFKALFWKKDKELTFENQEINQPLLKGCKCGSGLAFSDCHAIEFALPVGERPDPD